MTYEIDKREFQDILRGLKGLPKEANKEMREASNLISDRIVIPKIQQAMAQTLDPKIVVRMQKSVRKKSDRIPAVKIGYKKKVFSGGASTIVMRYGTIKGVYKSRSGNLVKWPESLVHGGAWTEQAAQMYLEPAYAIWRVKVADIVNKWNRGKNG